MYMMGYTRVGTVDIAMVWFLILQAPQEVYVQLLL